MAEITNDLICVQCVSLDFRSNVISREIAAADLSAFISGSLGESQRNTLYNLCFLDIDTVFVTLTLSNYLCTIRP